MEGKLIITILIIGIVAVNGQSYFCDFESDLCDWRNDKTYQVQWIRGKGRTLTDYTGPSTDHTTNTDDGYYVYINSSNAKSGSVQTLRSRLSGPTIKSSYCLEFWYHMFGDDIRTLSVFTAEVQYYDEELYFERSYSQGDRWKQAVMHFDRSTSSQYEVIFEADLSKYTERGDIALDDISLTQGACPSNKGKENFLCSFDEDDCGFTSDYWKLVSDSNPPYSYIDHPSYDHTLNTKYGRYWILEDITSQTSLQSPVYSLVSPGPKCVHFYYYLGSYYYGGNELSVKLNCNGNPVWSKRDDLERYTWVYTEASIEPTMNYSICFGIHLEDRDYSMSIDDVKIIDGLCPESGFCNFENDLCTWINTGQINWARTEYSDPVRDHTTGSGGYIYVYGRSLNSKNSLAQLESERFKSNADHRCFNFWYNMKGNNIGTLKIVKRYITNTNESLWLLNGDQGGYWRRGQVLTSNGLFQVIIQANIGNIGYNGYIALDDFTFKSASKCNTEPPEAEILEIAPLANCNFDDLNFCNWTEKVTSDMKWKFSNKSNQDNTGPLEPATGKGHYIFVQSSDKKNSQASASIKSPWLDILDLWYFKDKEDTEICFSFYYHMFGAHIGNLTVLFAYKQLESSKQSDQYILWRRIGTQPDKWFLFEETIKVNNFSEIQFEIEARPGDGFAGDIALDDVGIKAGKCPKKSFCDFDVDLCDWTPQEPASDSQFYWAHSSQTRSSGTGPTNDHTLNSPYGQYMQTVSKSEAADSKEANLISTHYKASSGYLCLKFWYYRPGFGTGTLSVYTKTSDREKQYLYFPNDVGNSWQFSQVTITEKDSFQIIFRALKGPNNANEIAIDDVEISISSCQSHGSCSFKTDYCGYTRSGDFDWLLGRGRVVNPKIIDPPKFDHDDQNGMFLYADLTSINLSQGNSSRLISEILDATETSCLSFWYYLDGIDFGTFSIKLLMQNGSENSLLTYENQVGQFWDFYSLEIRSKQNYQVVFEMIRGAGPREFAAISDVKIRADKCRTNKTVTPDIPDNKFKCTFDEGTFCEWRNSDSKPWKIYDMSDTQKYDIPKFDHTTGGYGGGFAFMSGKGKAKLYSPDDWDSYCLTFWYFAQANEKSTLRVLNQEFTNTVYWKRTGEPVPQWQHALTAVGTFWGSAVTIIADVDKGSISIDDIGAIFDDCPTSKICTFEDGTKMCNYRQALDNEMNWNLKEINDTSILFSTPDHTTQSLLGQFLYLSFNITDLDEHVSSKIYSPEFKATKASCVTFWYQIYTYDSLTLNAYAYTSAGLGEPLWSVSVNQGLVWHGARFTVVSSSLKWQIAFEGISNGRTVGQLALDDISVDESASCPDPAYCTFEDASCLWENVLPTEELYSPNSENQHVSLLISTMEWTRHVAKDPYGPPRDHTLSSDEGVYLLFDARNRKIPDRAIYKSEVLKTSGSVCFKFWYNMPGDVDSNSVLKVFMSTDYKDADEVQAWSVSNENVWKEAALTITPKPTIGHAFTDFWLYLVGYAEKNPNAYIAVDDLVVMQGKCSGTDDKGKYFKCNNGEHILHDFVCNFKNDCLSGEDEINCGNCNFDQDMCGWNDTSNIESLKWMRSQPGNNKPYTDITSEDGNGYFADVTAKYSSALILKPALLTGPELHNSGPSCVMKFWFYPVGRVTLNTDLLRSEHQLHVWMPDLETIPNTWNSALVYISRNPSSLKLQFRAERTSDTGYVAIDGISFSDCATNSKTTDECSYDQFMCKNKVCIPKDELCDFTDNCGDNSDELDCNDYHYRCSFDKSFCDWKHLDDSESTFARVSPSSSLIYGPTRDHTTGSLFGKFLLLTGKIYFKPARLVGPTFQPKSGCKMRFYYDMRGSDVLSLQVKTRRKIGGKEKIRLTLDQSTSRYNFMHYILELTPTTNFQVIIEGKVEASPGYASYIAIDDVSFSSDCVPLLTPLPTVSPTDLTTPSTVICNETQYLCASQSQCIDANFVCNFVPDCEDRSDETQCGACDFSKDMCGLQQPWIGNIEWERIQGQEVLKLYNSSVPVTDPHGQEMAYFAVANFGTGSYNEGVMRSPKLQQMGLACSVQFYYHVGYKRNLKLSIQGSHVNKANSIKFEVKTPSPWRQWEFASVHLGNWPPGHSLEFTASSSDNSDQTIGVAIDEIMYVNCDPYSIIKDSSALSCTFEEDECLWFPDNMNADFDWKRTHDKKTSLNGPKGDHTNGQGYFMFVSQGEGVKTDYKAHLVSLPQLSTNGRCLRFWYFMYGQDIGRLNVLTKLQNKTVLTIWSRLNNQGYKWQLGQRTLQSDQEFTVIFEAIMGTNSKASISLDDIEVFEESCPQPVMCDFEADTCDWQLSGWQHVEAKDNIPSKDHTTESELGHYATLSNLNGNLTSPPHTSQEGNMCLKFWYYLQGNNNDQLSLQLIFPDNSESGKLWVDIGEDDADGEWIHSLQTLNKKYEVYQVRFVGEKSSNSTYIAIDDIQFREEACPLSGSCDFEEDFCAWRNLPSPIASRLLWQRNSGSTPNHGTGPSVDHTTNSADGWYIFLESSSVNEGKTAILASEVLHSTYSPTTCFTVWYHMHGTNVGEVNMSYRDHSNDNITTFGSIARSEADEWKLFQKSLTNLPPSYQFHIAGTIKGKSRGDIALDDIEITDECNQTIITTIAPPTKYPPSQWDCEFDTGFCSWDSTDKWFIKSGRKAISDKKGPIVDSKGSSSGRYAYFDPPDGMLSGNLVSDEISMGNYSYCFKFYYYLYSNEPVSLELLKSDNRGTSLPLWITKKSGIHKWEDAYFTLNEKFNVNIIFRANRTLSNVGDIAVDDISFTPGNCPILRDEPCGFELEDICGFEVESPDFVFWERISPNTDNLNIGPKTDVTFETEYGYYMIAKPTVGARDFINNAHLVMPNLEGSESESSCLQFWYQIDGTHVRELNIHTRRPNAPINTYPLWSEKVRTRDKWRVAQVTIEISYAHDIVFEAVTAKGNEGFITVDEVILMNGKCPLPGSCDFEKNFCTFQNKETSTLKWIRNSGPTPTNGTGPDFDHTLQTAEGSYIYLHAANPDNQRNLVGILESEYISLSVQTHCLSFWAHMRGKEMGSLLVNISFLDESNNENTMKTLWMREHEYGTDWFNIMFTIDMSSHEGTVNDYQMLFIGKTRGRLGDIAIDDIELSDGHCTTPVNDSFYCNQGDLHVPFSKVCDFVVDCNGTGEDEAHCGTCDFEHSDCGWTSMSSSSYAESSWIRTQGEYSKEDLKYDHTTNSSLGWFVYADSGKSYYSSTVTLRSPSDTYQFKKAHAACVMTFWFYKYASYYNRALGIRKLLGESTGSIWELTASAGKMWNFGTANIGSVRRNFHIEFTYTFGSSYAFETIAIDDIAFENCGPPEVDNTDECTDEQFKCLDTGMCISKHFVCDLTDDCGDHSDELQETCESYSKPCTFDSEGDCDWVFKSSSRNTWKISASKRSRSYETGPLTDHTKGLDSAGKYAVLHVDYTEKKNLAWMYSPNYQINGSHCVLRFYYYLYGIHIQSLKVYAEQEDNGWTWDKLWQKDENIGQEWIRATIEVSYKDPFHFIIEGMLGNYSSLSDIAVDDISVSNGCVLYDDLLPTPATTPIPTKNPCRDDEFACDHNTRCILLSNICDFTYDCDDHSDEFGCGPCHFDDDMCEWNDESSGEIGWSRKKASDGCGKNSAKIDSSNSTEGYYMCITKDSGSDKNMEATLKSPPLPPISTHCEISFWYYMYVRKKGKSTFSLYHNNKNIWMVDGSTGKVWKKQEIHIPESSQGSHLMFKVNKLPSSNSIALDDISFLDCDPKQLLVDCDFDKDFCKWIDTSSQILKWKRRSDATETNFTGPTLDHTNKGGSYAYINPTSSRYNNKVAVLTSPLVSVDGPEGSCFTFWYHMYGKHVGSLSVELDSSTHWSKQGNQGNKWLNGYININSSESYKIKFVAKSSKGNQGVIAIDDVKLTNGPCVRTICDFEEDFCDWTISQTGLSAWVRSEGSGNFSYEKPKVDHTTNTEYGHFLYFPRKRYGDIGNLNSPYFNNVGQICLHFWYNMFGRESGTLSVFQKTDSHDITNINPLWMRHGDHQGWKLSRVTLSSLPKYYIEIIAKTGRTDLDINGYIAVDDINILDGSCSRPVSCEFEHDFCGWSNYALEDNNIEWVRQSGLDNKFIIGPDSDMTTGSAQGHYLYAYFSEESAKSRASLISEDIEMSPEYCFSFWYNLFNAINCSLFVEQLNIGNGWINIWDDTTSSRKYSKWDYAEMDIQVSDIGDYFNLRFVAMTNTDQDKESRGIAIDSVTLNFYACGATTPLFTTSNPIQPTYPPSGFECNFENGICGSWENDVDFNKNSKWDVMTGHNNKESTRPRIDHTTFSTNGHYLILQNTSSYWYNRKAIIRTKNVIPQMLSGVCFKFWYFIYGSSAMTLNFGLIKYPDGEFQAIWNKTRSDGPTWLYAQVHINTEDHSFLAFQGETATSSDIALDDFALNLGHCPPRDFCDVEEDMCGFSNDPEGEFYWSVGNGSTTLSGPETDHTLGTKFGNYFYANKTSNIITGDSARLDSGMYPSSKTCLRFYYYLSGRDVGTLQVLTKYSDSANIIWTQSGDEGNEWLGVQLKVLPPPPTSFQYVFKYIAGENSQNGTVALDDISVPNYCEIFGSCNFEQDMCMWENVAQKSGEQWKRGSGKVNTLGPESDITFGDQFGMYLYSYNTYSYSSLRQSVRLISPYFQTDIDYCFQYWYFRNGTHFPDLYVWKVDKSNDLTQLQMISQNDKAKWKIDQIFINGSAVQNKYRLMFEANFTAQSGFIALDDINVQQSLCPEIKPEPPTIPCDRESKYIFEEQRCDFYPDCEDGSDEANCGTECDFENGMCHWTNVANYYKSWNVTKANSTSDPLIDHTFSEENKGHYLKLVNKQYYYYSYATEFKSPTLIQSSATCKMIFWYYIAGVSNTVIEIYITPLHQSKEIMIFTIKGDGGQRWLEAMTVIGRIVGHFKVTLSGAASTHTLAVDDIKFVDCAIPHSNKSLVCNENEFQCSNGYCISNDLICDFSDDCGDFSDEKMSTCDQFQSRCNFEEDFCNWQVMAESNYKWIRGAGTDYLYSVPLLKRDHTLNSLYGHFLYSYTGYNKVDNVAMLVSPVMENIEESCSLRFFYTVSKEFKHTDEQVLNVGSLLVFSRQELAGIWSTEWFVDEGPGQFFEKAFVSLKHLNQPFEIIIESVVGGDNKAVWAIDDISFSNGCAISNKTLPDVLPTKIVPTTDFPDECLDWQFKCGSNECINVTLLCNFHEDCKDGSDEANCGSCTFNDDENPMCGWKDMSSGQWIRKSYSSGPGYYLYLNHKNSGSVSGQATLKSPDFKKAGSTCGINFWYYMNGSNNKTASLRLSLNQDLKNKIHIWGNNIDSAEWQNVSTNIGRQDSGWTLEFIANHMQSEADIALDKIEFTECAPPEVRKCKDNEFKCADGGCINANWQCDFSFDCEDGSDEKDCSDYPERCDFESGMGNWNHESDDTTLKWKIYSGETITEDLGPERDHTYGNQTGHYLFLPPSETVQKGVARISSTIFMADLTGECRMRFWFHMHLGHTSELLIQIRNATSKTGQNVAIISGNMEDEWKLYSVSLKNKFDYKVFVQGTRNSGQNGGIGIDDISFSKKCKPRYTVITTPLPTVFPPNYCKQRGEFTCEDNSCVPYSEVCDFKEDCPGGIDEADCSVNCTFEDQSMCGWNHISTPEGVTLADVMTAEKAHEIMPKSPSKDITHNSSSGLYLLIYGKENSDDSSSDFISSKFSASSASCKIVFWYASHHKDGKTFLYKNGSECLTLWELNTLDSTEWDRGLVGIGRNSEPFYFKFQRTGTTTVYDDFLALDDIEFLNCPLPKPRVEHCHSSMFFCRDTKACIDSHYQCDLTDDCGDGSDEEDCDDYVMINFEDELGTFRQGKNGLEDDFDWLITDSKNLNMIGAPVFDHTYSNSTGHFAYLMKNGATYEQKAQLISEIFEIGNIEDCEMRFYHYSFGKDVNKLNIYIKFFSNGQNNLIWHNIGHVGKFWQRDIIQLPYKDPFQLIIEGRAGIHGKSVMEHIAIDDISFTKECRLKTGHTLPVDSTTITSIVSETTTLNDCPDGYFQCTYDRNCIQSFKLCDFREDCGDATDEINCVQTKCNFEDESKCGWFVLEKDIPAIPIRSKRDVSDDSIFKWTFIRADDKKHPATIHLRPDKDHTINYEEGWYAVADGALGKAPDKTELVSVAISKTHARCDLQFWFACNFNFCPLNLFVEETEGKLKKNLIWQGLNGGTEVVQWIPARVHLGSLTNFRVFFEVTRTLGLTSVALDDVEFINCPPPLIPSYPDKDVTCNNNMFKCNSKACIKKNLMCDFSDDCGDNSDEFEKVCEPYKTCTLDYECNILKIIQPNADIAWTLSSPDSPSLPDKDHTSYSKSGKFLSAKAIKHIKEAKPQFSTYVINGKGAQSCSIRFWHNFVGDKHTLNIYRRTNYKESGIKLIHTLFSKGMQSNASYWERAEIPLGNSDNKDDFEIVVEATLGKYGSVNIDDISLTPSCSKQSDELPDKPVLPTIYPPHNCTERFPCDNGNCYSLKERCNFYDNCGDGTDEKNCGTTCDFESGMCGWFNQYASEASWILVNSSYKPKFDHTLGNKFGHFMITRLSSSQHNGQQAQLHSRQYTISGPNCKLSFWYFLDTSAELSIIMTSNEMTKELWRQDSSTGNSWKNKIIMIKEHKHFFLTIQGTSHWFQVKSAIDDLEFISCSNSDNPTKECTSNEFECNDQKQCIEIYRRCDGNRDCEDGSDESKCNKQNGDCDFNGDWLHKCKWREVPYSVFDLSTACTSTPNKIVPLRESGCYVHLNSSDHSEGEVTALASPQFKASYGKCYLRLWYFMKGSEEVGLLRVISHGLNNSLPIWQSTGKQANIWLHDYILVGNEADFMIVFEATVGRNNQADIAIDEVSFTEECKEGGIKENKTRYPCFDGQFRCANLDCILGQWRCNGHYDCSDGSDEDGCSDENFSSERPKTIPTTFLPTTVTLPNRDHCEMGHINCKDDNQTCIAGLYMCDGVNDCPNGNDEQSCGEYQCQQSYFCRFTKSCISIDKICDSNEDCGDHSDESLCECPDNYCQNGGKCSGKKAPVCDCPKGYTDKRCVFKTKVKDEISSAAGNNSWIAGVVVATCLLAAIIAVVWYKRKSNPGQTLSRAVDNPVYGLNFDNFPEIEQATEATSSPTAIENPLYAYHKEHKDLDHKENVF